MTKAYTRLLPAVVFGALLAGCASDDAGSLFSTAAISPAAPAAQPAAAAAAPKVDTVCLQLAGQIDAIKKDGSIEKLEKVAAGKTANVQVKRAALAKQAELNKANADYMSRCSPAAGRTAAAAPAAAAPAGPTSGVTSAQKTQ